MIDVKSMYFSNPRLDENEAVSHECASDRAENGGLLVMYPSCKTASCTIATFNRQTHFCNEETWCNRSTSWMFAAEEVEQSERSDIYAKISLKHQKHHNKRRHILVRVKSNDIMHYSSEKFKWNAKVIVVKMGWKGKVNVTSRTYRCLKGGNSTGHLLKNSRFGRYGFLWIKARKH